MADTKLKFIPHMNTNSCCCFSSKTGCLIIGYLGAVISSIYASLCLIVMVSVLFTNESSASGLYLFMSGIHMAMFYVHYSLIQGVNKQEPRRMYLWIYLSYIQLILSAFITALAFIALLIAIVVSENFRKDLSAPFGIFVVLCLLAILDGISYHIFASVVTHCQELISMRYDGRIYNAP